MADLIELNCKCCDCGGPLGMSIKLLSECIVREEFPDGEVSDVDVEILLAKQALEPFVKFPLILDPVTMTMYFPLWCSSCNDVKHTAISVEDLKKLSQPTDNRN